MIKRSALTFIFSTALVLGVSGVASAQDDCSASPLPDSCLPVAVLPQAPSTPAPSGGTAAPAPAVQTITPRQTLPVTGAETTALALGGLLLVSAGGAMVWRSNRVAA